ncbi:LOW QUALITY PROTEIN: galectin-9-like [Pomacea canaliculata]|uniref:LOW QUALITY PROTEIN: galectin-9-like n=1 Tax=Pomacea canaliculata TaxID=400727 RepID=UPI000D72AE9C|nr:LOW QUALITY PROTEIN: galectin-9-like [Pomacea canaliculata]
MTTISPVHIPYSGAIPGGVHEGLEIQIQGTVPQGVREGFSVNLCQTAHREPSTTLHFNPRFHQNGVALNHLENGKWGKEERRDLPLHKGSDFDLRIKVKSNEFKIKINGSHFTDFVHRMPKETAQYLVIDGEVAVSFIRFSGLHGDANAPMAYGSYGGPQPAYNPAPMAYGSYGGQPIYNPPIPFTTEVPGGVYPGRKIFISGVPNHECSRFTVNMQSDSSGGDVAMHFDVRFKFGDSHNVVVRNHCHKGQWANEERHANHFPFAHDANFDMVIHVEQHCYKVDVNNQHFVEFNHRVPVQSANILSISGDVKINQIRFQ